MVWTTFNFSVGQVLTASQMNNLYNNFASFAAKEANAPVLANGYITAAMFGSNVIGTNAIVDGAVTEAKHGASSVSQSKLKTASGGVSVNSLSVTNVSTLATLPGGSYGFYPRSRASGDHISTSTETLSHASRLFTYSYNNPGTSYDTGYVAYLHISAQADSTNSSSATTYADQVYVTASPPYNMGDGDIPLFVFALVDSSGSVIGSYVAEDPPWAYNGPTDIRPVSYEEGTKSVCRFVTPAILVDKLGPLFDNVQRVLPLLSASERPLLLEFMNTPEVVLVPITNQIKNADMPLIPQPFKHNMGGVTSILLDPMATEVLRNLHLSGANVHDLLIDKSVKLGNQVLRAGPPRIPVYSFKL